MAAAKKGGLGRGLGALFTDVELNTEEISAAPAVEKSAEAGENGSIVFLDIHQIQPNENQPRKVFEPEKIEELAKSIEMHGVIQPIMVVPAQSGYRIVAGERRWRAAQKAKLKKIPCLIRELTEEQNMLIALIENMQREDLNAIEEAEAIQQMLDTYGMTQEEIARSVGKSRPYISNSIRLLRLPESVQKLVSDGKLSGGHARALAAIKDGKIQETAARKAAEEGWSVRRTELFAGENSETKKIVKAKPRQKNRDVEDIEEELKNILGTKVSLAFGAKRGKIEIEYYSRDELERLIDLLRSLK